MFSSILASVMSLLSSFFKWKVDKGALDNTPAMEANQVAHDEVVRQDLVETQVDKALQHDEKSLEDLRRAASE